jgi:prepilin-type N-terminal cleavage/methylation domain-containing protein
MRDGQRGFTLVELLIGAAVAAVVSYGLVVLAGRLAASNAHLQSRLIAAAATERLLERLSAEAASAWSVYRPDADQLGVSNADGHELDFYAQDGSHRPYGWAYRFDAASGTLTRYSFEPGVAGSGVAGEIVGTFSAFTASDALPPAQLGNPASPVYDPLFANANATAVSIPYAAGGTYGGNALVGVHVTAAGVDRSEILASATAPTAFTVVVTYTPSPAPVATATPIAATMVPASTPTP